MIGHTKATAGVAGLVKAALALHHRVLPPTIGVTEPNPEGGFDEAPFYVNTEARPWIRGAEAHPRRAGVSAFGFGGTDFHIVLEEYTGDPLCARRGAVDRRPAELLVWRGTRSEITAAVEALGAAPRRRSGAGARGHRVRRWRRRCVRRATATQRSPSSPLRSTICAASSTTRGRCSPATRRASMRRTACTGPSMG